MAQISMVKRWFLVLVICFLILTLAQSQKSPCPNIFTYTIYPGTDQVVGLLKIRNIKVGQVAQINLLMTIQAKLPTVSFYFSVIVILHQFHPSPKYHPTVER